MSLPEILISSFILILASGALWNIQRDFSSSNKYFSDSLKAQEEARRFFKTISAEMRSLSPSSTGAYAIEQASSTSIVFYNDIDDDQLKERLHYYLDGTILRKGVTKPTGVPLSYNLNSETLQEILHDLTNATTSTPFFSFYDSSYAGTSTPLAEPITVISVRLIKMTVVIDADATKPPGPSTLTTQVSPRNIKDNL